MLPDVQYTLRPGIVELRWGDPAPELLPAAPLSEAAALALRRAGPGALNYGAERGPGALLEPLAAWLERREGVRPLAEHLFTTSGVSGALDLLATLYTRPGDVVLAEAPTYHLALRVFGDHRLRIVQLATDDGGLRPEALESALAATAAIGRPAPFLYLAPTFGNPTGRCLDPARRPQIMALCRAAGTVIIEDDVYRDLWYDAPPPPPLEPADRPEGVIRLGSFSKILAPAMRLGWLVASPEVTRACMGSGLLDSGGGQSAFAAHVAGAFMFGGALDTHIDALRAAYRARRDLLAGALGEALPPGCRWRAPGGGFFIWVRLPDGADAAVLLPRAEAAGVSYVPGARFDPAGGGACMRLSFSLLPGADLREGARRLGAFLDAAL
jgi:DNA-binding transcriptional MocR family regulator